MTAGDFDGDGFADLAVGTPGEGVDGVEQAGAVNVIYGTSEGLASDGNQFWHQGSARVPDTPLTGEQFGAGLAAGDFDDDGFAELAVGVSTNVVDGADGPISGAVNVLAGSEAGLTARRSQLWHQDRPGIEGVASDDDWFGRALTTADFDGDGFADLAVGVQNDEVSGLRWAGAVNVIYGSPTGLTSAGDQLLTQDTAGVLDDSEIEDFFGIRLGADDYDADGADDLAVGVPFENLTFRDQGGANVLYGVSGQGLRPASNQFWSEDTPGLAGEGFTNERFGATLS